MTASGEYVKRLENLADARQTFKNKVRNYKLEQFGIMENVAMHARPIIAEQVKTREAIESLALGGTKQENLSTPKKQIEFQDTFHIDFRNIDQNLPKSLRPVFSQDGFQIGKEYIDVDRENRLMRVHGKHKTYAISQELIDLIKGQPLENYDETHLNDYYDLALDVQSPARCKRVQRLKGLIAKTGDGFSFLPDNVDELKARLTKLLSAAKEGHSNVFNEGMAILKRLLEKKFITHQELKNLSSNFSLL